MWNSDLEFYCPSENLRYMQALPSYILLISIIWWNSLCSLVAQTVDDRTGRAYSLAKPAVPAAFARLDTCILMNAGGAHIILPLCARR